VTKVDKLWLKFQGSGTVTYSELVKLMAYHGFKEITGKGSSRKFENNNGLQHAMHQPHPDNELKTYQKNDARNFIKSYLKTKKQ